MKILFVVDVPLEDPSSGSERVLIQQVTGLAQRGLEVCAITRQAKPPSWIIRNVAGVQEGCYCGSTKHPVRFLLSLLRYPSKFYDRFRKNIPFQAAICHQPFNCFSLLMMRKLQNLPLLYVFHSPSHEEYLLFHEDGGRLRKILHAKTRRFIERFCLKRAQKVIVLSHYMKEKVQEIHGIPKDRIVVNPGGVDIDYFQPSQNRKVLKRELAFPENALHLLTVRNLEPRMGLDNLLQCIRVLKKDRPDIHLILGGEGEERKNLEKLIRELGLENEVTMTGFIQPELLPKYYGASDFFVLPTRRLEGFGLVTPESMACGTPVLGTPIGGTKEILSRFDPQFLFQNNSPEAMAAGVKRAITDFFDQHETYEELRSLCREYAAKNYSWKRHVNQLKAILEEVLPNKR